MSTATSPTDLMIESITFHPEGVVITFFDPTDVRVGGRAVMSRQISLSRKHPDYEEDMDRLHAKALRVLKNGLEDWTGSEPFVPDTDDEDDDRGMGE